MLSSDLLVHLCGQLSGHELMIDRLSCPFSALAKYSVFSMFRPLSIDQMKNLERQAPSFLGAPRAIIPRCARHCRLAC